MVKTRAHAARAKALGIFEAPVSSLLLLAPAECGENDITSRYQVVDCKRSGVSCYTGYSNVTARFTSRLAGAPHISQMLHEIRKLRVVLRAGIAIARIRLDNQHALSEFFT